MNSRKDVEQDPVAGQQDAAAGENGSAPPVPRWVKVLGLLLIVLVVLLLSMHLLGGGLGPGMHGAFKHSRS